MRAISIYQFREKLKAKLCMVGSDNTSVDWETVELWLNRVTQHEDNFKFVKGKRNLIKVASQKAGSKKLFCQIVVVK